jgi:hypothetical protein
MRTNSSPCSPKPIPGATATSAFSTRSFEKFEAAEPAELLRDRNPGEHRSAGGGDWPAGLGEALDEHVTPPAIDGAHLVNAIRRAVQSRRGGHLDRGEGAVIEVGFHPGQRREETRIPDSETDPPARHRERLRHRGELDRDVHGARHLQDGGRRLAFEINLSVGEVREDENLVLFREGDEVAVEIEVGYAGGRVRRVANHDASGFGIEWSTARSRAGKNAGVGSAGTERMEPPAMRKPKAWIG